MIPKLLAMIALAALAACSEGGGNPFDPAPDPDAGSGDDGGTPDDGDEDGRPIDADGIPVPGTAAPSPQTGIVRREPPGPGGDGYARAIAYDARTDTFRVDNLAFDSSQGGVSTYRRGDAVDALGPFAVYENVAVERDPLTGRPIEQFVYRAIYGVGRSGETQFAIVRTGSYLDYGFGGFVYQRDGGVTIPASGQASYRGRYAGLRDFDGRAGLEYATAAAAIDIDFDDFDDGAGVRGAFSDRRLYDLAGRDITGEVIDAWNAGNGDEPDISALPVIRLRVGPATANDDGEILGEAFSAIGDETFEAGKYYALLSGARAQEIVGVLVLEADDPRFDGVTVRETGGFVVYR